jgi:transposase InsO family protein
MSIISPGTSGQPTHSERLVGQPFQAAAGFQPALRRKPRFVAARDVPVRDRPPLKSILKTWIAHFNHARPHMSLGPGVPAALGPPALESADRQRIPAGHAVRRAGILGGLHHEYWLEKVAA